MHTRFGLILGLFIALAAGAAPALDVTGGGVINDTQRGPITIDTTANTDALVNITFTGDVLPGTGADNKLVITARGETAGNNHAGDGIDFLGTVSIGSIAVNGGNSGLRFHKAVTVTGGIDLDANAAGYRDSASHGDSPRVVFNDTVSAAWLRVGNGLNTTQFEKNVTLTGHTSAGGKTYALAIGRGKTVFKGDVATNGSASANVIIAGQNNSSDPAKSGADVTFEKLLKAANASIHIGGTDAVDAAGDFRGDTSVRVLGTGGVTADTVYVGVAGEKAGTAALTLDAGAEVNVTNLVVSDNGAVDNSTGLSFANGGKLVFGSGSSYAHNGVGAIALAAGATMEVHGGSSASAPTQIADMFDRTTADAKAGIRMVGATGDDTGHFAGDMNLAAGSAATVQVTNNAAFAGRIHLTDAGSKLEVVSGGGAARVTFEDAVTVNGAVSVESRNHAGATAATDKVHFKSTLDAASLNMAWGSGHTVFDGAVTLDGFDAGVASGANKATLVVGNRGVTVFNGAVDTTAAYGAPSGTGQTAGHALFTGVSSARGVGYGGESVTQINNTFNVGNANVYIGYHGDLTTLFGYSATSAADNRVILGSNGGTTGHLRAANIHVGRNGYLELAADASAEGHLVFGSGSYFAPNKNVLDVTGDVDIQRGAILYMDPTRVADQGAVILQASNGITGHGFNGLYRTSLSPDGKSLSVDGVNGIDVVHAQAMGRTTRNTSNAGRLATSVMMSAFTPRVIRTNLAYAAQKAAGYADGSPGRARAAFVQLFGEHGLTGLSATRDTARSFSERILRQQSALREDGYRVDAVLRDSASDMAYASLPYAPRGYTPASGYDSTHSRVFNPNRIWAGGFGAWTRQEDRDNQFGYKYNSGGAILGYDRNIGDFVVGATAAYSNGTVRNNEGFTETEVDTFNIGLYGSYNHASGFFVDGNMGFGHSWNNVRTDDVIFGGRREGKYGSYSFQTGTDFGYRFELPGGVRLIPSAGAHYVRVHQKGWRERLSGGAMIANWYRRSTSNHLSLPLMLKVNKTFQFGESVAVTPEIRGAWVGEVGNARTRVRMGYVGSSDTTPLYGVDSGRSRAMLGAGVKARFAYNLDAFVDYNLEFRGGYKNHNFMGGVGWSF